MPEYRAARSISVYLSMSAGEVSTSGVVDHALRHGKRVFVPYIYRRLTPSEGQPASVMDMLELQSIDDFASLQPDHWGIPALSNDSVSSRANSFGGTGLSAVGGAPQGLDLILLPGMAFDSSFGRLGRGKGFYDYFLHRCRLTSSMPFRGERD